MKKILLSLVFCVNAISIFAQNITNEKITVLKGGITVLRFAGDISNFVLDNKQDYNINIEEDRSIRIWAKSGVINPTPTILTIIEGKRSHQFNINFKEKGDFNSTYYDYTNLNALKNRNQAVATNNGPTTTSNNSLSAKEAIDKKAQEQRAMVLAEEKRKREIRTQAEQKKLNELAEQQRLAAEEKLALDKRTQEANAALMAEEKIKKQVSDQKIAAEKSRQQELQLQIEKERNDKLLKEAALLAEKQKKLQEAEYLRLAKAEEINYANAKKAREENERRLAEQKNSQLEQMKVLAEEKAKRDQLLALIEAEKRSQELLDQRIEAEKRIKEERAITIKKEKEIQAIALEKKRVENELMEARRAEEERLALQKRIREENEQKLLAEKQKQQETIQELLDTKKQQDELKIKLNLEKQQRESLEKMLAEQKAKRQIKEKELEKESVVNNTPIIAKAVEPQKTVVATPIKSAVKSATEPTITNVEGGMPVQTNYPNSQQFPNINFKTLPQGQIMESNVSVDSMTLQTISATLMEKENNPEYANAATEIDGVKIKLANISVQKDIAYVCFEIENNLPEYFVLGATALKILDAETGKKTQLNPYHLSSFPVVDGNSSKKVVYVMKAERNVSPDSFVMITIRERQTSKKFELNFPGNFYTDALK